MDASERNIAPQGADMNAELRQYIAQYPSEIQALFATLRSLLYANATETPKEKLWAKLPSYYVRSRFVRLIPFKDHINIEAEAAAQYANALPQCKLTPKGMLQIYVGQPISADVLAAIFHESL